MDIVALRRAAHEAQTRLAGLTVGANSTDAELTAFEAATADLTKANRLLAAAEGSVRAKAATAIGGDLDEPANAGLPVPPGGQRYAANIGMRTFPDASAPMEPGIGFAQVARAMIVGKGSPERAHAFAASTWGDRYAVTQEIGAALQANDANSGGFLVPERFSAELVGLLWPKTTIRRACMDNGNVIPLIGGTDTFPTVESGTSAYYLGEGNDITSSEPTFGQIKMVEREMAALVPMSNKLLRHSSVNIDMMIRDMFVRSMAQTEDLAFLRGTGVGPAPKGLRYWAPTANVIASNATVNLTNVEQDARKAELAMMEADIPMIDVRWIMPPRVFTYLRDLRNSNGVLIYPAMSGPTPMWRGYKSEITNNVPKNLGSGSDSEVYLVDFAFVMVADSYSVRIDASDTASYQQSGALVSAFSKNQTVLRALTGHDFGPTRPKAIVVLTGVLWGT
jgi:HK97 family phage major capsid protein